MALKINYAPLNHVPVGYVENAGGRDDIWDHPLHNEGVFIPPQRMLEAEQARHADRSYQQCPAWKSYWSQTWVVYNQIDLKIEYNKQTGLISNTNFPLQDFNKYMLINEGSNRHFSSTQMGCEYNGYLVFQLAQSLFMWLPDKQKNIWVELAAHPDLYHKTGLEFLNVEYPFSRWCRPANGAFKAHSSKFEIKRGQPLYTMRFRGAKNNAYDLRRWKDFSGPPKHLQKRLNQHQSLKQWVKGVSWNLIKNDVEEKKCPFRMFR